VTKNARSSASELVICGWAWFRHLGVPHDRAGEYFWGRVDKVFINLEGILSRAHGNFDEQNKVLDPSKTIINYRVIIINANYNYKISAD